jgi:hypothetical protein
MKPSKDIAPCCLSKSSSMALHCWRSWSVTSPRAIESFALVGDAYGFELEETARPIGQPRRSDTQWEYWFAMGERLDGSRRPPKDIYLYLYFGSPEFLAMHPVSQGGRRGAVAAGIYQGAVSKRKGPKPVWFAPRVARPVSTPYSIVLSLGALIYLVLELVKTFFWQEWWKGWPWGPTE